MHELPPKLMLQTVGKVRGTLATVHISPLMGPQPQTDSDLTSATISSVTTRMETIPSLIQMRSPEKGLEVSP